MIRWNRVAVAFGCAVILFAVVLALTPVAIRPSSTLPIPLQRLLPPAVKTAEVSCGSVVSPHDPAGFGGVLATIASVVKTDCTRAGADRFRIIILVSLVGSTLILLGLFGFTKRRAPTQATSR
jgi:hypothetical protein